MRVGRRLAFAVFIIAVALLMAEGGLRLYFALAKDPPHSRYVRHQDGSYRLRPGPFWEDNRDPNDRINAYGFRDVEHSRQKQAGFYRIVGIGDSFVLGAVPINENFLRVTEGTLNDHAPIDSIRFEMVMMGLGGYEPENELNILRSTALDLGPDLVVLCFFVGNDVTGISLRGEVLGGELYFTRSSNIWHNLLRKSRLFVLAEKAFVTRWRCRNLRSETGRDASPTDQQIEPGGEAAGFHPTFYYLLIQKKRLPVYGRAPSEHVESLWTKAEGVLREFDRLCRQASVPWILLLIPAEEQVDPEVRRGVWEALTLDPDAYDLDAPQRRLKLFSQSMGIEVLDLLPDFRAAHDAGERLYIPNDTHWNSRGNRLAGEVLARRIRDRILAEAEQGALGSVPQQSAPGGDAGKFDLTLRHQKDDGPRTRRSNLDE